MPLTGKGVRRMEWRMGGDQSDLEAKEAQAHPETSV